MMKRGVIFAATIVLICALFSGCREETSETAGAGAASEVRGGTGEDGAGGENERGEEDGTGGAKIGEEDGAGGTEISGEACSGADLDEEIGVFDYTVGSKEDGYGWASCYVSEDGRVIGFGTLISEEDSNETYRLR